MSGKNSPPWDPARAMVEHRYDTMAPFTSKHAPGMTVSTHVYPPAIPTMTRESIVAAWNLYRASQSPLFDMFEQHKCSYHKASQHASAYIKFAIPSKIPLSTMKELVKNTVRYVSFDEILFERVVNKAVVLGRKCEKSFAYNARQGLRDTVYLYIKYTTGGNLRFSMND